MNDERFLVSGWEDDLNDIDPSRNPEGKNLQKVCLLCFKILFLEKLQEDMLNACENGSIELVKQLIEDHPELINSVDKDKYTPLHRACYSNNVEIVDYLLQKGANIAAQTEMMWQPLHSCCQWNSIDCAALLIRHGADINAKSEGGKIF